MQSSVFDRTLSSGKEISPALYNLTIGLTLCWGFFVNWIMVQAIPAQSLYGIHPGLFFVGFFVCCMAGSFIMGKSDNPLVSFLGYNMIVVPFGLVVNMAVGRVDPSIALEAMKVTGEITFVMMLLGSMYPAFFRSIGRGLFVALLATIVIELLNMFFFHQQIFFLINDWW